MQSRNEKIADLNASGTNIYGATATNKYSGWLDDTDYGEIGKQQMASGARPEEVLQTYTNRLNKEARFNKSNVFIVRLVVPEIPGKAVNRFRL